MRVIFRFKGKSPRHADVVVQSEELGVHPLGLAELRELWNAEQVINKLPGVRLHLEVTE